ncbi:MAG TPA: CYTH domain-containing protein [Chloroflexota bacterium]|nr:CYTH domain-containing protein [Chloroflexota bacterium]
MTDEGKDEGRYSSFAALLWQRKRDAWEDEFVTRDNSPGDSGPPIEVEAKFYGSERAFRLMENRPTIADWRVADRRQSSLRDTYWDTPDRRLLQAGRSLRVRETNGGADAELTLKEPVERANRASAARTEWTVATPPGAGPIDWEKHEAAAPIVERLREIGVLDAGAGSQDGLVADLVLLNPRRDLVLRRHDDEAVLSLDEVTIEGHPYRRRYVEIELRHGTREMLDSLAHTIAERYNLKPSRQGKVHAARAWLAHRAVARDSVD